MKNYSFSPSATVKPLKAGITALLVSLLATCTSPSYAEVDFKSLTSEVITSQNGNKSDVKLSHLTGNPFFVEELNKINNIAVSYQFLTNNSFILVDMVAVAGNNAPQERKKLPVAVKHRTLVDVFFCLSFISLPVMGELRLAIAFIALWWGGDGNKPLPIVNAEWRNRTKSVKPYSNKPPKLKWRTHKPLFLLVANILKQCQQLMLEPPYCVAKGIGSHNLLSITATDIQQLSLPIDPSEPKRAVTVCYGFEGVLTVAILETLDGEQVALQVFDGVPDDKNKYARWLIGQPVVMGAYYRLGDWISPSVVLITEGIADAISCYEATDYPVLAAISKSQLLKAAKAVKAKYPHNLIVICGDNDADGGGQRAAIEAAKAVNGVVVIPSGFKDFNDLHQAQGLEVVRMTIDAAIDSKKAASFDEKDAAINTPPVSSHDSLALAESTTQATQAKEDTQKGTYFFLNEDNTVAEKRGVYFVGISKEGKYLPPMQVCGVLKIKAITRNQDHQEHGFLLEWLDRDNHKHYWSMPAELFKGDGADYRGQLLSCGLYIAPTATARMRLAEYIQNHHTPDRALCVDKTGWYQRLFVTPSHTYGKQSENEVVIYQSSQSFINGYRQRGTLDEWRDKVAVLCVGNARLVFSICVAFAGSLLRLGHEESGGFHLRGNSSVGKSTGQHLACSVWGSRDYKQTWRATINGLEGIAALYNDGLLVLDERWHKPTLKPLVKRYICWVMSKARFAVKRV